MRMSSMVLAVGLAAFGAGCASVGRDWKQASRAVPPADDITGAWEGTWVSEASGHKGRLRGLLTRKSAGEYEARFHASFWKIFSARYTVALAVTRVGENDFRMEGKAQLGGLMGGEYHYRGVASPTRFSATYTASKDHGTFEMERVRKAAGTGPQ